MAADSTSDNEDMKKQVATVIAIAQAQLVRLISQSTDEYQAELLESGDAQPAAWMLMKDGKTVKRINMDEQAVGAPPSVKLMMYRAAIKSVAQRKKIVAAAILYSGQLSETDTTTVLVIEHEHMVGVSGHKVVGYELSGGEIMWGEPVGHKKPFEWFYESKKSDS
ncbi:hypothetical protein [Marinobacter sp. S6332]|uniref:hypothetical protein n=1 Tax=Marinobacter sp. S6332 TaxID=2926403 RepID=UPI001FF31480|nr:hypothetical protein [Marinobacter sp. S6332]MCK0164037.1 hypothetical protein [Marinobacter sp. S6332]